MKLWLISQDVNTGYDTYNSAVVAADSEMEARVIRPLGDESTWVPSSDVKVEYIGEAKEGTSPGVILASFNAG